MLKAIKY